GPAGSPAHPPCLIAPLAPWPTPCPGHPLTPSARPSTKGLAVARTLFLRPAGLRPAAIAPREPFGHSGVRGGIPAGIDSRPHTVTVLVAAGGLLSLQRADGGLDGQQPPSRVPRHPENPDQLDGRSPSRYDHRGDTEEQPPDRVPGPPENTARRSDDRCP